MFQLVSEKHAVFAMIHSLNNSEEKKNVHYLQFLPMFSSNIAQVLLDSLE